MKLQSDMTINGKAYKKGDEVSWLFVYPFFFVHMGLFGLSGFFMAYTPDGPPLAFLYAHGGIAIFVYLMFYLAMFGREEVKWMFINAGLGLFGLYAEIGFILNLFGTTIRDYPVYVHVTPFLYYVLYTFLLRQALIDLFRVRDDSERRRAVERAYVIVSVLVYGLIYLLG